MVFVLINIYSESKNYIGLPTKCIQDWERSCEMSEPERGLGSNIISEKTCKDFRENLQRFLRTWQSKSLTRDMRRQWNDIQQICDEMLPQG